jgi:ABC-2 type transport system ATP-binding protein
MANYLVDVRNVTKKYGNRMALNDVSLTLYPNEIVSLLGVNGAGKTTLSSIIASLHPCTSGDVLFKGKSIYEDLIGYRMALGFCAQKQNLGTQMNVREYLQFAGSYYLMPKALIKQRVDELMEQFSLSEYATKSPKVLSGGYRQRLLIARSLIHNPQLVILDEPTVALDAHIRRQLWETIKNLKNMGVTVLMTTHYIDEAEVLSDRICLLRDGKIDLIGTPQELMADYDKDTLEDVFVELVNETPES